MKDIVKSYLGHLGGYVIAAASIVSGLDPKLIPPQYSFLTAIAGLVVVAAHHGYAAGSTNGAVTAAANAASKVLSTAVVPVVLCVMLAGLGLTGCKTPPTPTQQAGITVAVDIATGAAIQNGVSPAAYQSRAVSFKAIAVKIKGVNDAGSATLATLAADLSPLIAALPPADQLAAHALVAALTPYLEAETAGNPQLGNAQATLDTILQAVIDSCGAYGA